MENGVNPLKSASTRHMPGKGKILLIDDDAHVTEFCDTLLSSRGYTVVCASNGFTALNKIEGTEYDLVILDINMPQINGVEFCIRALKIKPELKERILFTTGAGASEVDQVSRFLNIPRRLLPKPFSAEELLGKVRVYRPASGYVA